jgi:hypothetical protein
MLCHQFGKLVFWLEWRKFIFFERWQKWKGKSLLQSWGEALDVADCKWLFPVRWQIVFDYCDLINYFFSYKLYFPLALL